MKNPLTDPSSGVRSSGCKELLTQEWQICRRSGTKGITPAIFDVTCMQFHYLILTDKMIGTQIHTGTAACA